jgi:hypothetical protein
VTVRPEDLRGEARDAFRMWRDTFGLSEAAAMNALVEDGVITLSEDEQLARRFSKLFGLSEAEARRAVAGRGGPTVRTVSRVLDQRRGRRSRGTPAVGVEDRGACSRPVSSRCLEEKALREAAFAVFQAAPDDSTRTGWRRSRVAGGQGYGDVRVRPVPARAALLAGQAGRSAGDSTGVASVTTGFWLIRRTRVDRRRLRACLYGAL